MLECMHQKVLKATKVIVGATCYVVFNCDENFTVDK